MSKQQINKIIPKLRFPEFRNDKMWVETTLEKISSAIFDGTHQTPKYIQRGIPFFSVENIVSGNKNKYISKEDYLAATTKNKVEKGDILITRIGTIGVSKIVDWDYEFSIYVTLAAVKKSEIFDSYYLLSFLQSEYYQKEIRGKALLNAIPAKINMDELRKTKVLLPPDAEKNEQRKIADCFSSLDELITGHAQRLEALRAHKKGLMQRLFPAVGQKVPKLRFAEFIDNKNWEEVSLESLVEKVGSGTTPLGGESNYLASGRPFIRSQNVGWGVFLLSDVVFIGESLHQEALSTEVKLEDVLLTITGASIGRSAVVNQRVAGGNVNQHVCIIRTIKSRLNPIYLNQYLISEYGQMQIDSFQAGGNRQGLNFAQIRAFLIPQPPTLDEQKKIACVLSSLDDYIIQEEAKVEQLKSHKRGLMQSLFPVANQNLNLEL